MLGEVLPCASAVEIKGVHAILLDCADVVRIDRIRSRDGSGASCASQEMLCWAAWLRMHASDPQWRQDVIQSKGAPEMNWESWSSWKRDDAHWDVKILDNTYLSIEETTCALAAWVNERSMNENGTKAK